MLKLCAIETKSLRFGTFQGITEKLSNLNKVCFSVQAKLVLKLIYKREREREKTL